MSRHIDPPPKPRGRPRSTQARTAILKSAHDLMAEHGPGRLTIEAVAARAGVGKPTIYRYWANSQELAMAALLEQKVPQASTRETLSPLADLERQVLHVVTAFSGRRGRQVTQMMAASEADSEVSKAFRNQVIMGSREQGRAILERAQTAGHVRPDLDMDVALDLIYGPIFYRLLVGHADVDAEFATGIVHMALKGLGSIADRKTP